MADAKISITTEAKNDGLEKLNKALAEGQQEVEAMTRELKNMKKATEDGTKATKEQAAAMVKLRQDINAQKDANKAYAKEITQTTSAIKKSVKAMADGDKGARGLASAFKLTEGFTTAFSVALGSLAATIVTGVVSAMGELASQVVSMGAQMQQSVAHLSAMTGSTQTATEAYRALNDAYRSTNFDETAVQQMGTQLMRMGYSAQNAASLIRVCADAAAGLGTGQQGAQQLVEAISRMQAVGELTSKQMTSLKMAGVDMDAAFRSLGMTGEEAMKAVENGTLDTQRAIGALTEYLGQYEGKMAEAKNNTIDAWADVTGNLQTMCAEIGKEIFDAFNQSEIVQELIDFTQALVDMVRSDATGAFTDLKDIASEVLNFIGGLLGFVLDTIKLIIIILHDAYAAFRTFGAEVVEAVRPAVDMVLALYDAVKAVLSSVGKNFGGEVSRSWRATFGTDPDDADSYAILQPNKFKPRAVGGGGGRVGGGGGGGADAMAKRIAQKIQEEYKKALEGVAATAAGIAEKIAATNETKEQEMLRKLEADRVKYFNKIAEYRRAMEAAETADEVEENRRKLKLLEDQWRVYEEARKAEIARQADTTVFNQEMQHIQNMLDMQQIYASQSIEISNSVLEARRQQLEELLKDTKINADRRAEIEQQLANVIKQIHANAAYNVKTGWQEALRELANQQINFKDTFVDAFGSIENSLVSLVSGTESAKDKFQNFCKEVTNTILKAMTQIIIRGLITNAIMAALGMGGNVSGLSWTGGSTSVNWGASALRGGNLFAAGGGYITGPGTGTSDSIPAMLSNGEYVLRSSAVDRIGVATLNRMNRYADGGYVGNDPSMYGNPPVVINIENQTGVPVDAEQTSSTFDGEKWVIGVVMKGMANNTLGMRSVLKGAMS